jgi:hypothetical protein
MSEGGSRCRRPSAENRVACRLKPSIASQPLFGCRFVAARRRVVEVEQRVRCITLPPTVAMFRICARGAAEDRLGQHRIPLAHEWMRSGGRVADAGPDGDAAVLALRNLRERQSP